MIFDCAKCKYHVQPRSISIPISGMSSCSNIDSSNAHVTARVDIDSYHRCSIYGCKKTSVVFNWPRCKKNRVYK